MLKTCFTTLVMCSLAILMSGCAEPTRIDQPAAPRTQTLSERADSALSQAAGSIAPEQQQHQLAAAELFVQAGKSHEALMVLDDIAPSHLTPQKFADYTLLYATLALDNDHFFLARQLLSEQRFAQSLNQLPISQQKRWHQLRGELFSLLGENTQSLTAYMALSALTESAQDRQQVHEKLWQVLSRIPEEQLKSITATEHSRTLAGWYSLANISRQNQGDLRQQLSNFTQWQRLWPNHPGSLAPPTSLISVQQTISNLPSNIAVLLPLQGGLAQAGKAIRNGFLAAWYDVRDNHGETPRVRFYNTANVGDIGSLYHQTVADGAQLVIGPVEKEKVQQLLTMTEFPVPTIALNYSESPLATPPKNFYQFGLSAIDEAKQIADRAWIEGQRTAIAITPNNRWGTRARNAFRQRWQEKGGTLIEAPAYGSSQSDFAPLLKPVLHIDHSNARKKRLQQILGKQLAHTPRRRQDVDMIFMAAYPDHARQIKPTLDFLFARDLQIYGTSHLYTGIQNPGRNRDLEGIRFSAMPWTLPGTTSDKLQPATDLPALYRHIFALGVDAYHLHQWLGQMTRQPTTQLFGRTGTLQLNALGAIEREQPWAEFRGGRVRAAEQLSEH